MNTITRVAHTTRLKVHLLGCVSRFDSKLSLFFQMHLNPLIRIVGSSFAIPAIKPGLNQLCQNHITDQHDCQQQPIQRRKSDKPEGRSQRRNSQPGAHCNDDQRSNDQLPAGTALNKRDFVCTDDVYDKSLREERLYEPTGVKEGRVVPGVEDIQHDKKSQVIEY
jgi:hypothetical protein